MTFHPDRHMPGCMMPDGGDCCTGHADVVEDWHKQRREIERLRAALEEIVFAVELDDARRTASVALNRDMKQEPKTLPNPLYCERCDGRGYLVADAEWEPYAVQCDACKDRRPAKPARK